MINLLKAMKDRKRKIFGYLLCNDEFIRRRQRRKEMPRIAFSKYIKIRSN